jgi:hypothetical protein
MKFPDIDYQFWTSHWKDSIGQLAVYRNKNISQFIDFKGNINDCLGEIRKIVLFEKCEKAEVLRVVDLIYSWGGKSGRMFYAETKGKKSPRKKLEEDDVFSDYMHGVGLAKEGNTDSIEVFKCIDGIGSSYASKHAHFWSLTNKKNLLIIDSKIAGSLGYKTISDLESAIKYDQVIELFNTKAEQEFDDGDPIKIERALFSFHNHYFKNDNSGWKNRSENKNFDEAQKLSKILFGQS